MLFSDLRIRDDTWPVLGQTGPWDRAAWPLIEFEQRVEWPGRGVRVYAVRFDEDLNREVSVVEVDPSEAGVRPREALAGSDAAVIRLRQALEAQTTR